MYFKKDFLKSGKESLNFMLLSRLFNSFKAQGKKFNYSVQWAVKCNLRSNLEWAS